MPFLTVGIPSQLRIGCAGPGEPADERAITVSVLSPAASARGRGRVTQLNLSATERRTPCQLVPSAAPVT